MIIENGCGYNTTTKDYPYLYWPAPDYSSSDVYQAFKYSMCVKECPTSNASTPVLCKEPKFFQENSLKFSSCQYYASAYSSNGIVYKGDPFRYGTKKSKLPFSIIL